MRAVLLSRYPRVDTVAWKRQVARELLDDGVELSVVYSRSQLSDQVRGGIAEYGLGYAGRYATTRRRAARATGDTHTPLADWARERGVDVSLHDRLDEPACLAFLQRTAPDLIICVGLDIIPRAVLEIPRLGTLNAHNGLLPRYRGRNATAWSVYHDDPVGVSVHWVDPGIDTGAVLIREPISVERGDSLVSLLPKRQQLAARLLAEASRRAFSGTAQAIPQRREDGRQYYRMHPVLREVVVSKLARGEYRWSGSSRDQLLEEVSGW